MQAAILRRLFLALRARRPLRGLAPALWLGLLATALLGCGERQGAGAEDLGELGPRASIDELQRLKHTARSCEASADCPSGSHCDDDAGRCDWACFADSDCGAGGDVCTLRGECVVPAALSASRTASAAPLSSVSSQLATDHPACQALPLAQKLAALDDLAGNPAICFEDLDCPCGSYCGNDATCRFECYSDSPTTPPFCTPGEVCSVDGRCNLPSGTDAPRIIVDLEATPELISGNTAPGPLLVPVELRLRAKAAGHLAAAPNVTLRLEVVPRTGGPTPFMARVRCATGAALATSCLVGSGWSFGADPEPLRSSPRTVWIELPQTTTADDWTVMVRSEWSDSPISLAAFALPIVSPPRDTGHFTGTITWTMPVGEPLIVPVEADVNATHVLLRDTSRLLLPDGVAVLSKNPAETTAFTWLTSDTSRGGGITRGLLDVDTWLFEPTRERLTSAMRLTLGNGPTPAPLTLQLDYHSPLAPRCTSSAPCGTGHYCNLQVGVCLPGSRGPTEIIPDGSYLPSSALPTAHRDVWGPPLDELRAASSSLLGGEDAVAMERAMCVASPAQTTAGRFGSANPNTDGTNPAAETLCVVNGVASGAPQIFPFFNRTSGVTTAGPTETFNLYDTCLAELGVTPSPPHTPANLLVTKQCVSVARFMLAMFAPAQPGTTYPQAARVRLENQLVRQWVALHTLLSRGAVQEAEYDETIEGNAAQPMQQRLGNVVDLVEKSWRMVLRARRTGEADTEAAQKPDARAFSRPVAHWTFNRSSAVPITSSSGKLRDTESQQLLSYSGLPTDWNDYNQLRPANTTSSLCKTDADVALPMRQFTIAAYLGIVNGALSQPLRWIEKVSATHKLSIQLASAITAGDSRIVEVQSQTLVNGAWQLTGSASFLVPRFNGFFFLVVNGNQLRLHNTRRDSNGQPFTFEANPYQSSGEIVWGPPGKVELGCRTVPAIDELSFWDRPLYYADMRAYALAFITSNGTGNTGASADTLAARQLTLAATDEQAQGLAVHLLDGLAAHMELLSAYVRAEHAEMFGECSTDTFGPARTRVRDRLGRALRFATLVENDARDYLALAGSAATPWLPRYTAAAKLFAGKRGEVMNQLGLASGCTNPLGIEREDLPLYHGTEAGESARFFASSRFLTAQAKNQVDQAKGELNLARGAWQQQRASAFQVALGAAEKAERLRKIEQEYEGVLRKMCGVPTSGTILAAFRNGTMTSSNCFLKRETSGCAGAETMTIKQLPAQCLRGEIGEQILQIQAADLDVRNAESSFDRAIEQYAFEMEYCMVRSAHHEETEQLQLAHRDHMQKLRSARRSIGMKVGLVKMALGFAVGAAFAQPQLVASSIIGVYGLALDQIEQNAAEQEQNAEWAHQIVMTARAADLDLMTCFHGADNQKFTIDASRDIIGRAYEATKGVLLRLQNQQAELRALVTQAVGDLELEAQMVRVLPHHHFWLDDHIDAYRRHFRYAQRLTYLALRAFEYESQQSLGLATSILGARTPVALEIALTALEQRTAPMQGEAGFVVGEFDPVMSLRDEILRLGTEDAPPGFPPLSSIEALRTYLKSDAAKIYSAGVYVGRGIRFSLRPPPWAQFSCAERIWRITTALQVEGSPINNARLLLWQENSFGSQRCRAVEHGELTVARIRPEHNLLVGEGGNFEGTPFMRPLRYTAMEATGLGNRSREEMENLSEGAHSGFAGRGLYANYILLFPSAQFDNATFLNTVKDVLIRFDLVSVTDTNDPD